MTMTKSRPKTKRPSKTPEQHKADREAVLDSLNGKIAQLGSSAEWVAYLNFVKSFRTYSFNNQMLILMQRPDATRVAGFRKWEEFGRHVRKGEKAIKIFGYSSRKVTQVDRVTGEETEGRVPIFPILSVFDVAQTEGDELPTGVAYELPTTATERHKATTAKLTEWLTKGGWTVSYDETPGSSEGYTSHALMQIVISKELAPDAALAVLLHEAAHSILHEDNGRYVSHRGLCETEAESAAYVLASLVGLDLDASSISYIAGWSDAKPEVLRAAAENVRRAVNLIADALLLDEPETVL